MPVPSITLLFSGTPDYADLTETTNALENITIDAFSSSVNKNQRNPFSSWWPLYNTKVVLDW